MILNKILADKRIEVDYRKSLRRISDLKIEEASPPRDFRAALNGRRPSTSRTPTTAVKLIAEIKKASPSKGLIRLDFDPIAIGRAYEEAGASAISVLTDEKYFQGRLEYLTAVRKAVSLPLLRKDFIIDTYQVYESRAANADAILLIVAALSKSQLLELMALASNLGMASLVEAHSAKELEVAIESGAEIIGINNRNLQTFETKLETTIELAQSVPGDRILVSESGIFTRADVERLMEAGVDAILVGESLMRESDPRMKVKELLG